MYKEIKVLKCDRCGEILQEDDNRKISLGNFEMDFCDKCNIRFKKFWREFFRPDMSSNSPPFKPNKNAINLFGEELL